MSVCILPEIKNAIYQNHIWINNKDQNPMSTVNIYVEVAWLLSTGFGLFLIFLELGLVVWIKMAGFSLIPAISAIVTLSVVGVVFIIFAVGFYIRIIQAKVFMHNEDLEAIERVAVSNAAFIRSLSITTSIINPNESH